MIENYDGKQLRGFVSAFQAAVNITAFFFTEEVSFFTGLCFPPACFPTHYILVEKANTWAEALHYCRWKHSDLASVHNKEELDELVTTAQKYYRGHVWIGLYDDINSWRWSLQEEGYYGEGEAEFRMWKSDRPINFGGYENCAGMDNDGLWNDRNCKYEAPFVCYNGNKATVSSPSFILVNESKNWTEAQSYCRKHHTDLASVRNQSENDQLKTMVQNQHTWIGLYRDSWKWSDGSHISFTHWNTDNNEPNDNTPCVLLHQGRWEDKACTTKLYFVCSIVSLKRQVVRVKLSAKDSSVKLEDAGEAILQQLSRTLKLHSLIKDMKLTWRKQPDGKIFGLEAKEEKKKIGCNLKFKP
uniref:C-type mannose receptor 2-like n=1 Tax=Scatophagus argus TaxID=75038 RepID=UPI001ED86200|nr:C-type mannose receptor 2-like [Scatophagus argus]